MLVPSVSTQPPKAFFGIPDLASYKLCPQLARPRADPGFTTIPWDTDPADNVCPVTTPSVRFVSPYQRCSNSDLQPSHKKTSFELKL